MTIPLRPRTTPDPDVIEWLTSAPVPGAWTENPPPSVADLMKSGSLAECTVTDGCVRTRLGSGHNWSEVGPATQQALVVELGAAADAELERVACELAAGPLLAATNAHGGAITVERVERGVVEVSTQGACHGCPAIGATLSQYFLSLLRERGQIVTEVREIGS